MGVCLPACQTLQLAAESCKSESLLAPCCLQTHDAHASLPPSPQEVPFNNTRIENILSPQQSALSPVTSGTYTNFSPIIKAPSHLVMGSPPNHDTTPNSIMLATPGILSKIDEGVELLPNGRSPRVSLSLPACTSPDMRGEGSMDEDDLVRASARCMQMYARVCVCVPPCARLCCIRVCTCTHARLYARAHMPPVNKWLCHVCGQA